MSDMDDLYDRGQAQGRCKTHGHDWSNSADRRSCRRCGQTSTYGGNPCHNGHDWSNSADRATCRKCGAEWRRIDTDDGAAGW